MQHQKQTPVKLTPGQIQALKTAKESKVFNHEQILKHENTNTGKSVTKQRGNL